MSEFFLQFSPVTQALIATLFTWAVTAAGASLVFFSMALNQKLMDAMLGFAAGAKIFVVVEGLIPEPQRNQTHIDPVAWQPCPVSQS